MTFLQMRPAWSPDGRRLAAWTSSAHEPGVRDLVIVGVEDGRDRIVTRKQLHAIDGMVWLPDGSSVVVAAREAASAPLRLWRITLASGVMQPLTTDVSDYLLAGLTSEGQNSQRCAWTSHERYGWRRSPTCRAPDRSRRMPASSQSSRASRGCRMAACCIRRRSPETPTSGCSTPAKDARRQLTTHARDDFNPASSPDGTIVFASDRSGATGLWAMSDAGERSVRQLTNGGDSRPTVSPGRFRGISARRHPVGSHRAVAHAPEPAVPPFD